MSPLYKSAFELAKDIKSGDASASETLEYFIARIERLNGAINAVVARDVERARQKAIEADRAASSAEDWGPLHGVPLTIKDAFCTEGLVTTGGIPSKEGSVPVTSAVAVQRLIDAGAIVFAKTNVPFMSSDLQSYNDIYGCTNNPWDNARTPGGSSGGAAAAVAAGFSPMELGSDIGGSIRVPSHFNGVYGHKPSHGIVPQRGHLPPGPATLSESDLSVVGPIAHCVTDLEQALDILAGPLPEDAPAWRFQLPPPSFESPAELRVAVWSDDDFCPVDTEIKRAIETAADCLERLGARIDRSARPDFNPEINHRNYMQLLSAAMGAGMPKTVQEAARQMVANAANDDHSDAIEQARGIAMGHGDWLRANERRLRTRAAWHSFFENYDVLLCPVIHVTAFPHDHTGDWQQRTLLVNGTSRPYLEVLRWPGLTLNSLLPATAVPVDTSGEGLPIGMQIVAPYLADRTTLAVAGVLEKHHRAFTIPPGYEQ